MIFLIDEKVRKDFPILESGVIYFDNAASSLTPEPVLEAVDEYYRKYRGNIHRGLHRLSLAASEKYDEAREKVARFINAEPSEVVFTKGCTEGINLVAQSIGWKNGDRVVVSDSEHHSNIIPWLIQQGRGAKVEAREFGKIAGESKARLIAVAHVSNVLGEENDVAAIARERGDSLLLVDGAQSAPHLPIDVKKLGCDFFVFSGHKMLGPTGIGVLYMREEVARELKPACAGGGTVKNVSLEKGEFEFAEMPRVWEAGTPNIGGAIGLGRACDYLEELGMGNVHEHEKKLSAKVRKAAEGIEGLRTYGNGLIFSFNIKGLDAHDIASMLDERWRICVRSGHFCAVPLMRKNQIEGAARASFYIYNTEREVDVFVEALGEIGKLAL